MRWGEGAEGVEERGSKDLKVLGTCPCMAAATVTMSIELSLIECLIGVTCLDFIILSFSAPVRQVLYPYFIKKETGTQRG